ncbi:19967_t:CDS:2, partial [Racocetra fulgida]
EFSVDAEGRRHIKTTEIAWNEGKDEEDDEGEIDLEDFQEESDEGTMGINSTNNVFLLDVSQKDNYKWTISYDPTKSLQSISTAKSTSTSTISNVSNESSVNVGAIIGGTFGGIAGLIILTAAAVLIVRRYSYQHFTSQEESSNEHHP